MKPGDKVTDRDTGEQGEVVDAPAGGLVLVRLSDGAEVHYSPWELIPTKDRAA